VHVKSKEQETAVCYTHITSWYVKYKHHTIIQNYPYNCVHSLQFNVCIHITQLNLSILKINTSSNADFILNDLNNYVVVKTTNTLLS